MNVAPGKTFGLYPELIKIFCVLVGYLPYAWFSQHLFMPGWRWVIVGVGLYLSLSMAVRNLILPGRVSSATRTAWVAFDFLLWCISQKLAYWSSPITFPGLIISADVAMSGWSYKRGFWHWLPTAVLICVGPALDPAFGQSPLRQGGEAFLAQYVLSQGMAPFAVYAFVYLAARNGEERERVAHAHADVERANRALELANAHLREYARQVEEVSALRERNRIAREVHDTVAHGFTGLIMQLDAARSMVERKPAQAIATLDRLMDHASRNLAEIRRSVHALRPLEVEQQGVAALEELVRSYQGATGGDAELAVIGLVTELPAAHELCLFRALQEGLSNAFRHGHAGHVDATLTFGSGSISLNVEDDGELGPTTAKPGLGLVGIRERAQVLGGSVVAGPRPQGGYRLTVSLPVDGQKGAVVV